ncbi:unnamed protein product [Blepharisma stoltei]|uniref:Uncharacterized protein n=1 Tax=Blepharisma stoltei TaxID=1481888 RepID=A0AAU9IVK3_9CILI|nr:unnamed protein product [Blepharisma stoltei]
MEWLCWADKLKLSFGLFFFMEKGMKFLAYKSISIIASWASSFYLCWHSDVLIFHWHIYYSQTWCTTLVELKVTNFSLVRMISTIEGLNIRIGEQFVKH